MMTVKISTVCPLNPLTLMNDQNRISLNNITITSGSEVMRVNKISIRGILVDPILDSLNQHYKNCMANVWQTVRRITDLILAVKSSKVSHDCH